MLLYCYRLTGKASGVKNAALANISQKFTSRELDPTWNNSVKIGQLTRNKKLIVVGGGEEEKQCYFAVNHRSVSVLLNK